MKNFTFGGAKFFLGVPRGAEWPDFKKSLYRTVVSTHSQIFSILAELERVQKLGTFGRVLGPTIGGGGSNLKTNKKAQYRMVVRTYS